jgi:drug/metabolite transporter (DMT)-like permease
MPYRKDVTLGSVRDFEGLLNGLAGVVIFGLTLPATRLAVADIDPVTLALGRALIAAIPAGLILFYMREKLPPRSTWPGLAVLVLTLAFGFSYFSTGAMAYASAAHGGVVLAVLPLATAMAGAVLAGERPSAGFWLAGLAGSAVTLIFAAVDSPGGSISTGDWYLVATVVCAAIGYAQSGVLARTLGGWQVIAWTLVAAAPAVAVTLVAVAPPVNMAAPLQAWGGFLYIALMSQFFGFFFWNRGLLLSGVARTGQLQLMMPFVTLAASALWLHEAVGWTHAGFALAVAACVVLARNARVEREFIKL